MHTIAIILLTVMCWMALKIHIKEEIEKKLKP